MTWKLLEGLWYSYVVGKQYIPREKDIESSKSLAKKLKGNSDFETLNNILEWQEKNVLPWDERCFLYMNFVLSTLLFLFLITLFFSKVSNTIILVFILLLALSFFANLSMVAILSYVTYIAMLFITCFCFHQYEKAPSILQVLITSIFFGWFIAIFVQLLIKYRNIKSYTPEFKFSDVFRLSLSVEKIIRYRLGVCRDYAKLTAALLYNLYPKNKIFFLTSSTFLDLSRHVATGIEINNKIYILDQKLPILEPQSWLNRWKKGEAILLELKKKGKKFYLNYKGEIRRVREMNVSLRELMNLSEKVEKGVRSKKEKVSYTLRGKGLIFDVSDNIIRESLTRTVRNHLQKELVGNFAKVQRIELIKKNKDITIDIYLKW